MDVNDWEVVEARAGGADITRAEASLICAHPDMEARGALARNPRCPHGLVSVLSEDASEWVRHGVARREHLPLAVRVRLLRDESRHVRWAMASRDDLRGEEARWVAADPDPGVRKAAAKGKETADLKVQWALGADEDEEIRNRCR